LSGLDKQHPAAVIPQQVEKRHYRTHHNTNYGDNRNNNLGSAGSHILHITPQKGKYHPLFAIFDTSATGKLQFDFLIFTTRAQ
jgi:hypothetical protein